MVLLVGCTAYVTAPDNVMSYSLLVVTTYQLTNTFARGAACGCVECIHIATSNHIDA